MDGVHSQFERAHPGDEGLIYFHPFLDIDGLFNTNLAKGHSSIVNYWRTINANVTLASGS